MSAALVRVRDAFAAVQRSQVIVDAERAKLSQLKVRRQHATIKRDQLREEKDQETAMRLLAETGENANG